MKHLLSLFLALWLCFAGVAHALLNQPIKLPDIPIDTYETSEAEIPLNTSGDGFAAAVGLDQTLNVASVIFRINDLVGTPSVRIRVEGRDGSADPDGNLVDADCDVNFTPSGTGYQEATFPGTCTIPGGQSGGVSIEGKTIVFVQPSSGNDFSASHSMTIDAGRSSVRYTNGPDGVMGATGSVTGTGGRSNFSIQGNYRPNIILKTTNGRYYSNGGYYSLDNAGTTATASTWTGIRFKLPFRAGLNAVSWMQLTSPGTTAVWKLRTCSSNTVLATSETFENTDFRGTYTEDRSFYLRFSPSYTLEPNQCYRLVQQTDGRVRYAERYNEKYAPFYHQNGEWGYTSTTNSGTDWTDSTTIMPKVWLYLNPSSAKNIQVSLSVDDISTSANTATVPGHGLSTGDKIKITTDDDDLPAPLQEDVFYYVRADDADTLGFFVSAADAANNTSRIDLTDTGTGTFILNYYTPGGGVGFF